MYALHVCMHTSVMITENDRSILGILGSHMCEAYLPYKIENLDDTTANINEILLQKNTYVTSRTT